MNAAAQLQMFEPEGATLAQLVATHQKNAEFEARRAANLLIAGYEASAAMCVHASVDLYQRAAVCEMALQFEQLAGLA